MYILSAGLILSLTGCSTAGHTASTGNQKAASTPSTKKSPKATQSNANQSNTTQSTAQRAKKPLSVLYAGSMTNVMEHKIRPQLAKTLKIDMQGEGKGSNALGQMIRSGLASPDIFISASPSVNTSDLMGSANHNLVKWYMTLAQDQLVIAYSNKSRFKNQLNKAAKGTIPWYQVLESPGFRFGRTDPKLDPKGADTILMMKLAETYYKQPNMGKRILGATENPKQVFPEETLLAQLTSGQVDAIIAYKHEAVEWGVPYISLPKQINLGDNQLASHYASVQFVGAKGKVKKGAPIVFTITIPSTVKHKAQAEQFVRYMEVGHGHELLMKDGFTPIATQVSGNQASVPSGLKSMINGTSQ